MHEKKTGSKVQRILNRDLLLPYAIPYFAYVGIASLARDRLSAQINYGLKIIIVPLLLYWAWKWYAPITGPKKISGSVFYGIIFGLAGLAIWCLLLAPFIDIPGRPWARQDFFLRLFAASLIVPIFEELFIRGYIFRAAFQWGVNRKRHISASALNQTLDHDSINDVMPGAWNMAAIGISTLAFAAGHMPSEYLAAVAYSIWISVLWIFRKDLLSCIIAHGTTNLSLGLYVLFTGQWGFW